MIEDKKSFRVLIFGDCGTGKTQIISKYLNIYDVRMHQPYPKEIKLDNNETIKLNLIDTNGQEKYRNIHFYLLDNCDGIIILYSIDEQDTFNSVFESWIKGIKNRIDYLNSIPIYIVGNKCDLIWERKVSEEEAENKSKEYNFKYMEISIKNNININKLFKNISEDIYEKYCKEKNLNMKKIPENNLVITNKNNKPKKNVLQKISNFFKKLTKHF